MIARYKNGDRDKQENMWKREWLNISGGMYVRI